MTAEQNPLPDALAEVLRLADSLSDAAEDYRAIIPQFHAGNRRSMKARVSTIDDAISGLRTLVPSLQAMADDARRYRWLRDWTNPLRDCFCADEFRNSDLDVAVDARIDALNPIAKGE
jgi:hypothetical protein